MEPPQLTRHRHLNSIRHESRYKVVQAGVSLLWPCVFIAHYLIRVSEPAQIWKYTLHWYMLVFVRFHENTFPNQLYYFIILYNYFVFIPSACHVHSRRSRSIYGLQTSSWHVANKFTHRFPVFHFLPQYDEVIHVKSRLDCSFKIDIHCDQQSI